VFFVFEGIDGAGTTTQCEKLAAYFRAQNRDFVATAEPTAGSIGKFIRQILSGKTKIPPRALQFLFFADRVDHLENIILPAKNAGKIVFSDRYFLSSVAYSALFSDDKLFFEISKFFPAPDKTIFLKIDPKIAIKRISARGQKREIFEKIESLEKIAAAYEKYFSKIPADKKCVFDSGKMSADEIFTEVLKEIKLEKKEKK